MTDDTANGRNAAPGPVHDATRPLVLRRYRRPLISRGQNQNELGGGSLPSRAATEPMAFSADQQSRHVAMPQLVNAPRYRRVPSGFEPHERQLDLDDLPLARDQTETERALATELLDNGGPNGIAAATLAVDDDKDRGLLGKLADRIGLNR